jgi:hypothetical protein
VIYLSGEDPKIILSKRILGTCDFLAEKYSLDVVFVNKVISENLTVISTDGLHKPLFKVDTGKCTIKKTEDFDRLENTIKSIQPAMIVVDTKAIFGNVEGSGNALASQEIQMYKQLACIADTTVLLLHHTNKASRNGEGSGATAFRDASAIYDSVRAAFYLKPLQANDCDLPKAERQQYLILEHTKGNYGPITPDLTIKRNGYGFEVVSDFCKNTASKSDDLTILMETLEERQSSEPHSLRTIIEYCKGIISESTTRKLVKLAERESYLLCDESSKGQSKNYRINADLWASSGEEW